MSTEDSAISYTREIVLRDRRQRTARNWAETCGYSLDTRERGRRFLEEALELAQACGVTKDEVLRLADYTYGRAVGKISQEIGGVMVTLMVLASTQGVSICAVERAELERCLRRDPEEIKAKRASKIAAGIEQ